MIDGDEYLERIVAGIQAVTTSGADVTWNEVINGRQFDVVVRFQLGTLRYLVLIEVKHRTRKASATDLDAFVLKARDQNANKSVFVTAAGFQSGAITVAKRHAVDIFTVAFDFKADPALPKLASFLVLRRRGAPDSELPSLTFGEPQIVVNLENVVLAYVDGRQFYAPTEQTQMAYYGRKTKLHDGRSLDDIFQAAASKFDNIKVGESRNDEILIDPPQRIEPPDEYFFPKGAVDAIRFSVTGRLARPIRGNTSIDPSIFAAPVVYTNAVTGEALRFEIDQLPLGVARVSPGAFYFIPHPMMYFFCDEICGDEIHWYLVESFQNGEKISGSMTQHIKYSSYYIPVTDKNIISRLQGRLVELMVSLNKRKMS